MKVTRIQTGTVQTWLHLLALSAPAEKLRIEVPVYTFLIEYGKLKVLFDAGQLPLENQHPQADYFFQVAPDETLSKRLAALNIAPESIDYIVLSHLHSDHCDGLKDFPQTAVAVQQAATARLAEKFPNPIIALDGEFDLAGDGRIICLPTPGHAPCHQSLLIIQNDGSKLLLTGDAAYFPEALDCKPDPAEYARRQDFFDSLQKIRLLRDEEHALIQYSHYPYRYI